MIFFTGVGLVFCWLIGASIIGGIGATLLPDEHGGLRGYLAFVFVYALITAAFGLHWWLA